MREIKTNKIKNIKSTKLLGAFLSFDFNSGHQKMSTQSIPNVWLRWFLDRYKLDSPEGWKICQKIRTEIHDKIAPLLKLKPGQWPLEAEKLLKDFRRLPRMLDWEMGKDGLTIAEMLVDSNNNPRE